MYAVSRISCALSAHGYIHVSTDLDPPIPLQAGGFISKKTSETRKETLLGKVVPPQTKMNTVIFKTLWRASLCSPTKK